MLIEVLIFFCAMVGASLWKYLIRGAGEKKVKKHCFRAFIPCFLIDCFIGLLPFIVSLTTEETKAFADGLAALNIKGNTLLAINENIPPPLLFPRTSSNITNII